MVWKHGRRSKDGWGKIKMSEEKKEGLNGWGHNPQDGLAERAEEEFGEDFVDVEVEGVKEEEGNKMVEEEEKEVKEESTEQKKERYIDILVGIGFLKGKDKEDGKLRFYYKIDSNSAVGRTFDSRNPLGKFWCKEGENFLKDDQCKEIEIVKRFYSIREGKEEIPEKKEEVKKEIAIRGKETVEIKPNQVIIDAQTKADSLYAVVEKQHLFMQIHDKKYLTVEAWEILGRFCDLTATVEWVKSVELWEAQGFEARVVVTDNRGKVVSVAESMCLNDEPNWKGKPIFQLKSMCQTRAMSKAYRMCLSFIVSLAGYSPTPFEEMA